MKNVNIILMRHAQTEANRINTLLGRTDSSISNEGKIQIEKVTQVLKQYDITAIYASPSKRAIQTVTPIATFLDLSIQIEKDLREIDFGIYDGMTWKEIKEMNPEVDESYLLDWKMEGQESEKQIRARIIRVMKKIAKDNLNKTILVCSHGVTIPVFLSYVYGTNIKGLRKKQLPLQYNTTINRIQFQEGRFIPIEIGNSKHLEEIEITI